MKPLNSHTHTHTHNSQLTSSHTSRQSSQRALLPSVYSRHSRAPHQIMYAVQTKAKEWNGKKLSQNKNYGLIDYINFNVCNYDSVAAAVTHNKCMKRNETKPVSQSVIFFYFHHKNDIVNKY